MVKNSSFCNQNLFLCLNFTPTSVLPRGAQAVCTEASTGETRAGQKAGEAVLSLALWRQSCREKGIPTRGALTRGGAAWTMGAGQKNMKFSQGLGLLLYRVERAI